MSRSDRFARELARVQGWYFVVTGVWPIVHRGSFEWITGPKIDYWLVETVGALVAAIGVALLLAGRAGRFTPEIITLGAGSAFALGAIDIVYATAGRIRPIYLADAVVETAFIVSWLALVRIKRR